MKIKTTPYNPVFADLSIDQEHRRGFDLGLDWRGAPHMQGMGLEELFAEVCALENSPSTEKVTELDEWYWDGVKAGYYRGQL